MPTPKLEELLPYVDTLPPPTRPNPWDLRGEGAEVCKTITLAFAYVRYSTQLDMTKAWAYEGTVPGPTFVVDQKQTVHVRWFNSINETEALPYRVVVFPDPISSNNEVSHQNNPGVDGGVVNDDAGALTASIVVHQHGGLTAPDSDGWTENVYRAGRSMFATYGKAGLPDGEEQRAALLWYHDHAMGVTRLNVYAGLYGFWVIRDQVERDAINAGLLPEEDHELILLIQDRNFDTNADGTLNGAILHKTETSTAEMFGPFTLVNGVLWPTKRVPARPMRVRILNGSNSRTYCLRLVEVGPNDPTTNRRTYPKDFTDPPAQAPWWQVGTDGGLLDYPVLPVSFGPLPVDHFDKSDRPSPDDPLPFNRGLVLAPAERADLVIDFGLLAKGLSDPSPTGRKVALVNTAFAPFHGSTIT
jgi:spore coat protein A